MAQSTLSVLIAFIFLIANGVKTQVQGQECPASGNLIECKSQCTKVCNQCYAPVQPTSLPTSGKPTKPKLTITSSYASIGTQVSMTCSSTDADISKYTFLRNGKEFQTQQSSVLEFKMLQRYEGYFTCQVTINNIASDQSESVVLTSSGQTGSTGSTGPTGVPAKPGGFGYYVISSTSIYIHWSGAQGALGYTIQYRPVSSGGKWVDAVSDCQGTSCKVSELGPGIDYYFQIIAFNSFGESEPLVINRPINTSPSPATTKKPVQAKPGKPEGPLQAKDTTTTTTTLTWGAAQGAQWYTVEYRPAISGSTWITAESYYNKGTSFEVTGLDSGTAYYFQIIAHNYGGNSQPLVISNPIITASSPATTKKPVQTGSPEIPGGFLQASEVTATTITLTWGAAQAPDGGVVVYAVYRRIKGTDNWVKVTMPQQYTSLSFTVQNLRPGTAYHFKVVASNIYGTSPALQTTGVGFSTRPGVPQGPLTTSKGTTSTSVKLSWKAAQSGGKVQYEVEMRMGSGVWTHVDTVSGMNYTVKNLQSSKTFYFRVKAISSQGLSSDYLTSSAFTTSSVDQILPQERLVFENVTLTSCEVSWPFEKAQVSFSVSWHYTKTDPWTKLPESRSSQTSYTVESLTPGTEHYFKVEVFDNQASVIAIYQGRVTTHLVTGNVCPDNTKTGMRCNRPCSFGCVGGVCDRKGICLKGCKPGYGEGRCDKVCPPNPLFESAMRWGGDCNRQCSGGCLGGRCDVHGRCLSGCRRGFDPTDPTCEKDCPLVYFANGTVVKDWNGETENCQHWRVRDSANGDSACSAQGAYNGKCQHTCRWCP